MAKEFTQVLVDGLDAGHIGVRTTSSVIGVGFTMLNFVGTGNTFLDQGDGVLDISIDSFTGGNVNNINVDGELTGDLGGGESTVGDSGFAANVVSLANVGVVNSNSTIAPNAGDDFTFVKYQEVKVNLGFDLIISSGDFLVDIYALSSSPVGHSH